MNPIPLTTELQVLAWSVVLLIVHILAQGGAATASLGLAYNAGARDGNRKPEGVMAPRLARALNNLLETYPAFVALALALALTGKSGGMGATGAIAWIIGRILYLPLYAFGVPYLRTLAWGLSIVGLLMMFARLIG